MNWISVEDRLPDEWSHILVCNSNADIENYEDYFSEATYSPCGKGCCEAEFKTCGLGYISSSNVTNWMPLPEPPK